MMVNVTKRLYVDVPFGSNGAPTHAYNRDFKSTKLYVVRTVHFGMKLYKEQRNAQVFNLFIYLLEI
jgi:hypothetical protein